MVRISNILKKLKQKEEIEIPQEQETMPKAFVSIAKFKAEKIEERPRISELRISPLVEKETRVVSDEEAINLYEDTLSFLKEILKENLDYKSIKTERIIAQIEKIAEKLTSGKEKLLMLALIKESTDSNYLFCHSVNTCIYSLEIGLALGYERSKLIGLGISSLLYDIGMIRYLDLANKPKRLTVKEYDEIKKHTIVGSQILKDINGLNKIAIDVAYQHHERLDSSGYPLGLKGEAIQEYTKIVSLVDLYESMVHPRSYRGAHLPFETVKEILNNKNAFEYKLIKILIERIGIFPVGSLVKLNTERMARVIKLNPKVPLRPVVEIIDEEGSAEPKETEIIDLITQPAIYIRDVVGKS